jgi:H+/Cl- antiporter ClcA
MISDILPNRIKNQFHLKFILKWFFVAFIVGSLSGSASAVFLLLLEWAKETRESNKWLLFLLPVGGFIVASGYFYWGKSLAKGNNLIIEEVQNPTKIISFLMAPLVLVGTIITHVLGGSAGREGTAIQMGTAIADQLNMIKKFTKTDRRILLMCGMAAGFSSLFGTPLAGAIFALEIIFIGRIRYDGLIPVLLSALVANFVCDLWPIHHVQYHIGKVPSFNVENSSWILLASILFGLTSMLFSHSMHWFSQLFKKQITNPIFRPLVGGVFVALLIYFFGFKYSGLGIPYIVEFFSIQQGLDVFSLKLLLTVLTLSAGFKGGEVTPLFFIGAALGSALSLFIPLPVGLLAGAGFVAVFSGATNAPIACSIMGIELFGGDSAYFIVIACFGAYFFSGHSSIYTSQIIGSPKHNFLPNLKGKRILEIMK